MKLTHGRIVYLPDERDVSLSPYGKGNTKLGPDVYTYSRIAGKYELLGTCPGSSPECEEICYAKRIKGPVAEQYARNSSSDYVPPIPEECKLLRIHVSGDFDTQQYIFNWHMQLVNRPEVTAWAYTRSWRVPELLPALEAFRTLDNLQLFASMDRSVPELPPAGWRIAWIDGDPRAGAPTEILAHTDEAVGQFKGFSLRHTQSGTKTLICPEETKAVKNCQECGFCFDGPRNDVTFLRH